MRRAARARHRRHGLAVRHAAAAVADRVDAALATGDNTPPSDSSRCSPESSPDIARRTCPPIVRARPPRHRPGRHRPRRRSDLGTPSTASGLGQPVPGCRPPRPPDWLRCRWARRRGRTGRRARGHRPRPGAAALLTPVLMLRRVHNELTRLKRAWCGARCRPRPNVTTGLFAGVHVGVGCRPGVPTGPGWQSRAMASWSPSGLHHGHAPHDRRRPAGAGRILACRVRCLRRCSWRPTKKMRRVMVSSAEAREPFPVFLYVYLDDVDRTYRRVVEAGAVSLEPPRDTLYGDRRGMVQDRFGERVPDRSSRRVRRAGSRTVDASDAADRAIKASGHGSARTGANQAPRT